MIKAQFSAQIDGVTAKKDRTLSLRLGTQELTADDTSYLFDLMGKQIWVGIAETEIESLDVPEVLPEMKGDKTPSQRLRGLLYKYWEKKYSSKTYTEKPTFPRFYEDYMFKLCESLKDKIQ